MNVIIKKLILPSLYAFATSAISLFLHKRILLF